MPQPFQPGQPLTLNDRDRDMLGSELSSLIDDYEAEYRTFLTKDLPVWWQNYHAIPRTQVRNFPWKNASNVVIPVIQLQADAMVSRTFSAIFGHGERIWGAKTEREDLRAQVTNVVREANRSAREFDFHNLIYDWLSELFVVGQSVVGVRYTRDVRPLFFGTDRKPKADWVEFSRGVKFHHIPREQILWDTRYRIQHAPVVIQEHCYNLGELQSFVLQEAQLAKSYGYPTTWLPDAINSLKGQEGNDYSISAEVRTLKGDIASRDNTGSNPFSDLDIREIHIDWPILKSLKFESLDDPDPSTPRLPIVVHIHRGSRKVLRVTTEPYHLPWKPYFDGYLRRDSGKGSGAGLARKLYFAQETISTLFNQAIDAQTRANAIWAKTTDPRWQTTPLDPSRPLYVGANINSFEMLNVGHNPQPNIALMNQANIYAERLTGIADPAFGRESRQGGHPSPATSTLALLEQSTQMAAATISLLRHTISDMGMAWAILTQQYETDEDGLLAHRLGPLDAEDVRSTLLFPTDALPSVLSFDLVALSESLNPDTEMRRAAAIDQMTQSFWAFVLQVSTQLVQTPPQYQQLLGPLYAKSIEARKASFERFLDAGDIDDIERFTGELRRGAQAANSGELTEALGAAREMAQGLGAAQPSQLGAGPGMAGTPPTRAAVLAPAPPGGPFQ